MPAKNTLLYTISAESQDGTGFTLSNLPLSEGRFSSNGFEVQISDAGNCFDVRVTPPKSPLKTIKHSVTIGLRNFHTVIVPDSGRSFPAQMQLVNFWSCLRESRIFDVKAPIFILNAQNHNAGFAFGVVGQDYETQFKCVEPRVNRALLAYSRRLCLEISRGTPEYPIPESVCRACNDLSVSEGIYVKDYNGEESVAWVEVLRNFSSVVKDRFNIKYPFNEEAMQPLWCSWTDWHSKDVDRAVVLSNVRAGVKAGITNFIIDDGWFGNGLDSDFGTKLVFGDWNADARFGDIKTLSHSIRELGGKSIIWCSPHNVTPTATAFAKNYSYIMKDRFGVPVLTSNKLNLYCPCCAEGREMIANICLRLAEEYDTDGAKYDLFNTYPDEKCHATDHTHDTESYIEGLARLMELIWQRVRSVKPNYIVELKQNYGWVFLSQYGSMVRAGDTPYNPEGNFMRTAFIAAYTPYAINDYQSITEHDTLEDSARVVIKMVAVGVPSYSMDIERLPSQHKKMLTFLNGLYWEMVKGQGTERRCLDADLGVWQCGSYYYLVNSGSSLVVKDRGNFTIVNGNASGEFNIGLDFDATVEFTQLNCLGERVKTFNLSLKKGQKTIIRTDAPSVIRAKIMQS